MKPPFISDLEHSVVPFCFFVYSIYAGETSHRMLSKPSSRGIFLVSPEKRVQGNLSPFRECTLSSWRPYCWNQVSQSYQVDPPIGDSVLMKRVLFVFDPNNGLTHNITISAIPL